MSLLHLMIYMISLLHFITVLQALYDK